MTRTRRLYPVSTQIRVIRVTADCYRIDRLAPSLIWHRVGVADTLEAALEAARGLRRVSCVG